MSEDQVQTREEERKKLMGSFLKSMGSDIPGRKGQIAQKQREENQSDSLTGPVEEGITKIPRKRNFGDEYVGRNPEEVLSGEKRTITDLNIDKKPSV